MLDFRNLITKVLKTQLLIKVRLSFEIPLFKTKGFDSLQDKIYLMGTTESQMIENRFIFAPFIE